MLQGSLDAIGADPPHENPIPIRYSTGTGALVGSLMHTTDMTETRCLARRPGHVCFIPNCREFFIATAPHAEWGAAHAVWGEVALPP